LVGNQKGRNHLKDLVVDDRIILEWILRKRCEGVECIQLAQDKDEWLAVKTAINLWIS
jgi:hypothetical protein